MTNIDQFESLFKKAAKETFHLEKVDLENILVISDADEQQTDEFMAQVVDFLGTTLLTSEINWHRLCGHEHNSVEEVIKRSEELQPDLVCTFRNLHAAATDSPYSLGVYLEVLTQATDIPVLVLPSPHREAAIPSNTRTVMAIADHLTGDHRLVSYAARLTTAGGKLLLTHVEDQAVFERYLQVIGKIPSIDTEPARDAIMEQLLKEPHDYIRSCATTLADAKLPITVEEIVTVGHSLQDYKRLLDRYTVDLLVLNTKQEDQLAMHGLAYPLCVELRDTPILML